MDPTAATLAFSATLIAGVLLSRLAQRTLLSTSVLFLVAGAVLGRGGFKVIDIGPRDRVVSGVATVALFAVLFSDGMTVGFDEIRRAWRLPGRALAFGLPMTLAITAVVGYVLLGLSMPSALLLGAVLAPTDPVFARAIVGRDDVPYDLRHLLNVESGVNDGLSLPIVVGFLSVVTATHASAAVIALELVGGVVLGVLVCSIAVVIGRNPKLAPVGVYRSLYLLAVASLIFAIAAGTRANEFLAAFAGGITVATFGPSLSDAFKTFADPIVEVLKLAALMLFGAIVTPSVLGAIGWRGWLLAAAVLVLARPAAVLIALLGTQLPKRRRIVAAWFGPKGFASVVYGLLVLHAGGDEARLVFDVVVATVAMSILAHSSTDVAVARWLQRDHENAVKHRAAPGRCRV